MSSDGKQRRLSASVLVLEFMTGGGVPALDRLIKEGGYTPSPALLKKSLLEVELRAGNIEVFEAWTQARFGVARDSRDRALQVGEERPYTAQSRKGKKPGEYIGHPFLKVPLPDARRAAICKVSRPTETRFIIDVPAADDAA